MNPISLGSLFGMLLGPFEAPQSQLKIKRTLIRISHLGSLSKISKSFYGHAVQFVRSYFSDQGSNPCPLQHKHRSLTMGLPGTSFNPFNCKNLLWLLILKSSEVKRRKNCLKYQVHIFCLTQGRYLYQIVGLKKRNKI